MTRRGILGAGAAMMAAPALAGAGAKAVAGKAEGGDRPPRPSKPLVFGHRGSPAHCPEHSLASYARAIADGADFIEPDLVSTRDGILVARHENNIAETTDVADRPDFANRKATKTIDGEAQTGWFTEDFALAELKTLRAKERLGKLRPESQALDGRFQILTFEEIIDFVGAEALVRGRTIGLVPELKHSTYFAGIGLPLEARFMAVLRASRICATTPIVVQSFEVANLRFLHTQLADMHNVQLLQLIGEPKDVPPDVAAAGKTMTYSAMTTPKGLAEMATYAHYVAPYSRALIPVDAAGRLGTPTTLVDDAHKAGLLVCAWTFRPENHFLPADFRNGDGDAARNPAGSVAEIQRYLALGLDAFFTDDPAIGRRAVDGPQGGA